MPNIMYVGRISNTCLNSFLFAFVTSIKVYNICICVLLNKYGKTALQCAVYWGSSEVVKILLKRGAKINLRAKVVL